MIKVNQLHWFETQTHGGRKLYAKSHGLDWRIDPVNPTRRGDAERVEREKAKAQGEFEAHIWRALSDATPDEYTIGTLTHERVFKAAGLTNLSDLQAVLDQVEIALAEKEATLGMRLTKEEVETVRALRNGTAGVVLK